MIVTGITPVEFVDIVHKINAQGYEDNLVAQIGTVHSAHRFGARVTVNDSGARSQWRDAAGNDISAPGARRSASGRRLATACWHAYRDVLAAIFDLNPQARVSTAMAKYVGSEGFYANYPKTAQQNIGSMTAPSYMPELCNCELFGIPTHEQG